ncbi:Acg family FMN-binding oxidoreductase [Streptomyces milbemycinicus]|uniref:Acg family FMN-binding oxidoreductase n=1 Tax=Streptomyces milbemycinicus TaxID=476552 RepID=A0ABW8LK51_9ACTN
MPMRAHVGDQLIVESPTTGATRRDGEIVGVHHNDGTPPYDVRWSDSGRVSLVFPGPDAHIHHTGHPADMAPGAPAPRTATEARASARPLPDAEVTALARDAAAAPSMHNAQPWRFRYFRGKRLFHVTADLARTLPHSDSDLRALHLGCGAALMNLRVAAAHSGRHPTTELLPDPDDPTLLAAVSLTSPLSDEDGPSGLYPAIHARHTSRSPFTETEIPESVRTTLREAAGAEGVSLSFASGWHLQTVLDLALEAEARNLTDHGSAEDLTHWTQLSAQTPRSATEGVPPYAFGPRRRGGKAPMRDFAGGQPVPGRESADFESSPQLALLATPGDRPKDWLRAGQAMERVLLTATLEGLSSSFVTQALEWPDLRWPLRDPVAGAGHVHMVLRLGYGPPGPRTPRRPTRHILDIVP